MELLMSSGTLLELLLQCNEGSSGPRGVEVGHSVFAGLQEPSYFELLVCLLILL